jgi:hypothetical protein
MAKALPAGRVTKRRPLFGLFDADGWAWASAKAFFWLLVIIMTLGYVPDRAYYFIVSRTIDLGLVLWSPVNLCPPENGKEMPCPVPPGAVLPWQASVDPALPQPRAQGVAIQLGTNLLYAGGNDGSAATASTFLSKFDKGTIGAWAEGPALPEARENPAVAVLSGTAYLIGGLGGDGAPTDTVWSIGLDPDTSKLTAWQKDGDKVGDTDVTLPKLPEARAGASAVAVADGIVVAGGRGPDGKPVNTVWKSTLDKNGKLGDFTPQPNLTRAVADATIALEGTFLWVYGGSDESGPTGVVQRADYGTVTAAAGGAPGASGAPATAAAASPSASGAVEGVIRWATQDAANLPAPRTGAAGFAANGALYLVGGSDGTAAHRELYWALPDANGNLPGGWRHIDPTDLPAGIVDPAPLVSGATAILLGGSSGSGPVAGLTRSSLAPQEPFFRLGLVGVTVPGLQIGGEIGQQLGYLAAAGVGTGNFVILVIVGYAFNHRRQIEEWRERRRIAKAAKAPEST